ncbi:MAG: DsrE family protein [Aquificaceae bacterium]|nr:DsrE family protein [Aquificaceae bacterium]MCS7278139.1 DsrE family protein [Aquificaceae bacterium]MDW8424032.1 DsrE family protein [Aquificaceae bacterium]
MKVTFLIKGDPFSWKCHEALRVAMALGISCDVNLILIKDGVYALSRWHPEKLGIEGFERLIENLSYVRVKVFAEDTSLEERGLKPEDFFCEVELKNIDEIKHMIRLAEAVLVW